MNPFIISSPSSNKQSLIPSTTPSTTSSPSSTLNHSSSDQIHHNTNTPTITSIPSDSEYMLSNSSISSPQTYMHDANKTINNVSSSSINNNNNSKIISFEHLIRPPAPKFHQDHTGYSPQRSSSTSSIPSATANNNMTSSSTTTATITTPTYSPINSNNNNINNYTSNSVSTPPPNIRHNTYNHEFYNSSSFSDSSMISSSASTTSSSLSSSPRLGLMNYSPKHARKISASSINRNMKNLSLNLNGSNKSKQQYLNTTNTNNNGYHSNSSSLDSNMTNSSISSPSFVTKPSTTSRKLSLSIPLDLNSSNSSHGATTTTIIQHHPSTSTSSSSTTTTTTTTIITPSVTKTPALPPLIPRQKSHNDHDIEVSNKNGIAFKFPSKDNNYYSNINDLLDTYQGSTPLEQQQHEYLQLQQEAVENNKLKSPLILNGSTPTTTTTNMINDELNNVSLDDIEDDTVQTTQYQLSTPLHFQRSNSYPNSDNVTSNTFQHIPEELQESNQLNAYPLGPRNVLNNQIYLYSDPKDDAKININDYDLIINVAKECKDLTNEFIPHTLDSHEYLYYPWSHTTSISKSLLPIVTKMETFNNKGLKILVHCQCGVSRSASVIVAYFMFKFKIGVNEAYELLKSGTNNLDQAVNKSIGDKGNHIEACDKICPNMSLIFELMEFGDILKSNNKNK
ncbi:dual specificity phosphatase [Scheffersomyces coipomensis]|uniref:dual specificity phosphatase n=1 Tax=Scheffersomyces coipomensis TaxID=1788519 RepID=UPI00315D525B